MIPSEEFNLWNDTNNTISPLPLTETAIQAGKMMQARRSHGTVTAELKVPFFSLKKKNPIKWELKAFYFQMSKQRIRGKRTLLHRVIYKLPG